MMKRWLAAAAGAVVLALVPGAAVAGDGDYDTGTEGDEAVVGGEQQIPGGTDNTDWTPGPGGDIQVPVPWTDYKYVPACSANGPGPGSADALCGVAVNSCPGEREIRFFVYTRQMSADNQPQGPWEFQGTQCRGPDEEDPGQPVRITPQMIMDEAREAAPESIVHVEPEARSYVNVPTNFYAEQDAETVTVEVLGLPVQISWQPQSYTWDFGDGETATGAGVPGAPVGAENAVEHEYARSGNYEVTLTRSFGVTFTLPDGQVVNAPAPVESTSDPYPLEIGEVQSTVENVG